MTIEPRNDSGGASGLGPRAAAFLVFLPALLAAWPGPFGPLANDPVPAIAATGIALLASLPLLALALRHGIAPPRAAWPLFAPLAAGLVAAFAGGLTDSAEALRFAQWAVVVGAALVGGAALNERGQLAFARLCVLGTLLWSATALASEGRAGALGNTGTTSQVMLAGAAIGGWFAATRRSPWNVLGLVAAGAFAVHAALAPVIAGGLALVAALAFSAAQSPWASKVRPVRRALGLLAAAVLFSLIAPRHAGSEVVAIGTSAQPSAVEQGASASDLRGVEVRARIWARLPGLLRTDPLLGVGPGQFAARFPPFRDPVEAALSSHGGAAPDTVVEHPHSDWLDVPVETGALGAVGWWLFLLFAGAAAFRAIAGRNVTCSALGAALLALLVNGLAHGPLVRNTPAAVLGFALAGMLLTGGSGIGADRPPRSPRTMWLPRIVTGLLLAGGLVLVPSAWAGLQHARAMGTCFAQLDEMQAALGRGDAGAARQAQADARRALERAAAWVPEAGFTLPELAATRSDADAARAVWADLLIRRPYSVRALTALGIDLARAGDLDGARPYLECAVLVSPQRADLRRNLALLELDAGRPAQALVHYAALRESGELDAALLRGVTADQIFRARHANAACLLAGCPELGTFSDPPLGEECLAASDAAEAAGDTRWADALEAHGQRTWSHEHVLGGNRAAARRSLRQALRLLRLHPPAGPEGPDTSGVAVLEAELAGLSDSEGAGGDPE